MTQVAVVVGAVLLAILVGVAIPVLLQLRATLKSAQDFFDATGPKVDRAVVQIEEAVARFNKIGAELETGAARLRGFLEAAGEIGHSLAKLRDSIRTVTAVSGAIGPAVAAGFRAFFLRGGDGPAPADDRREAEVGSEPDPSIR